MSFTSKLRKIVHKKERQKMDNIPANTGIASFFIKDPMGIRKTGMLIYSAVLQYIYNVEEDGFVQIPSIGLSGTFGAGACGGWGRWSNTLTATGGSTTTLTLTTRISNICVGRTLRFKTGSNIINDATISDIKTDPTGTTTLYFSNTLGSSVTNGDTFQIDTGMYYIMNAYASLVAGVFKSYDPLTGVFTSLQTTGLNATRGFDGRIVGTPSYFNSYSTGSAMISTSTTMVTTKNWTVNQWRDAYQVRIVSGTGAGQVRSITSNTSTTLTVPAWTITPDATSNYVIEGNDDFLYLLGNNAVTMYRYQISTNTWTTVSPTVARGGAFATGGSANLVGNSGNLKWADETNIFDGRFIYAFRGGGVNTLDRYDIALNRWDVINYIQNVETFSTGSSYDVSGGRIYIRKENTGRYFYYDAIGNVLMPFGRNDTPEGASVVGDKLFTVSFVEDGKEIERVYSIFNTSNIMYRMLII